jgi:hypothetical protein
MAYPQSQPPSWVIWRKLFALLVCFAILSMHAHSHAKTILDRKYSGSTQTITYTDGTKKVLRAIKNKTKTTWADDHVTKTVTYTFSDKTTNVVKSTVKPKVTAGKNAEGVQKTVVTTYGDGHVETAAYKSNTLTVTDNEGGKKIYKGKAKTNWADDNVTKTVTYTFADETTNVVTSTVKPKASGLVLTAAKYPSNWTVGGTVTAPSVSAYNLTYGNKYISTQNGSSTNPFLDSTLHSKGITDPNAFVKTASNEIYDFRWGVPDRNGPKTSQEQNVSLSVSFNYAALSATSYYYGRYPTYSASLNYSGTLYTGTTSRAMQGVWITDEVRAAWDQGWTGHGVKIGVMDDFTVNDTSEIQSQTQRADGSCSNNNGVIVCASQRAVAVKLTHGEQVALIAGGQRSTFKGAYLEAGYFGTANDAGTYVAGASFDAKFSSPLYGVAKGADIYYSDYLTYANTSLFSQLKKWEESNDSASTTYKSLDIINLSFGNNSNNSLINQSSYQREMQVANSTKINSDILYVKAAGNSGCDISRNNCDYTNAVFYNSPNYSKKTIIVGGLTRNGGSLATYSNYAGAYPDRFLVADGRGIMETNGKYVEGTSFAAPRVAGYAAIVSQKFPNLDSEKLANVLLQTARYDTLACYPNCPTNLYGQGEASLSRALAPVGRLR